MLLQAAAKVTEDSGDFEDISTGDFLESLLQPSPAMDIFRAAMFLQAEILAMRNSMTFPPTPSEFTSDKIIVPDSLFNFLPWMLMGNTGSETVSVERVDLPLSSDPWRVLSLAQDMIHCVT